MSNREPRNPKDMDHCEVGLPFHLFFTDDWLQGHAPGLRLGDTYIAHHYRSSPIV